MAVRPLSAALRRKAEEELKETELRITTDLQTLRDWISQQPHIRVHSGKLTDQWLVAFLRGSKYNMEKVKGKLSTYYTLKQTVPEFFANRDPFDPEIQELLKLGVFLPLRNSMSDDSPRQVIVRVATFSHTSRPLAQLIKICLMIIEIMSLEDDYFTVVGEDVIGDYKDMSYKLLWHWTPSFARKLTLSGEKALSLRLKSMHLLNGPFFLAPALALFKMFLGAKIRDRMYAHSKNCETLYDHIDRSVLPEEYGGTDGTVQELTDYWKAKVESYRDWFLEDNICSDKSKTSTTP